MLRLSGLPSIKASICPLVAASLLATPSAKPVIFWLPIAIAPLIVPPASSKNGVSVTALLRDALDPKVLAKGSCKSIGSLSKISVPFRKVKPTDKSEPSELAA